MIKEKLNVFEADWAAMPQVEKEKLSALKNKSILVSGHNIARCLCYALLYQNEARLLNTSIIFAVRDSDAPEGFCAEFLRNEKLRIVNYDSLSELSGIDYIVHTGFCCEKSESFSQAFARETAAVSALAKAAAKNKSRVVLLSDSRVYGDALPHRVYAENEYADLPSTDERFFDNQLLRTIESLWKCEQKDGGFSLTVLRTGIVLGAKAGLKTFLDGAFEAVAKGEPCRLTNSQRKYSFVYITDVFGAIIASLSELPQNTVFNVASKQLTASSGMVSAVLHDVYGSDADIELVDGDDENACAISGGRMEAYDFVPKLSLETALELCVLSYTDNPDEMALPNTHDGRLDAIQKIQLAYLLEVDRICKKHNIKYFLGGGTLLGAVRHKGFIPWDDDSDIMMLREDYDKFAKVAADELPAGMTFQSGKTDKNCFYEFNKLRIENTYFATELARNHLSINIGIAFDIFCHDKTANSRLGQKLHLALTVFTRALVLNKWNRRKVDNGSRLQSAVTNFFVKLFPLRFSYFLMNHTISFFKRKKNAKYLYDGMGRNVYNGVFPALLLDEAIEADFEGYKLPIPKGYDEYLKFLYGDYMELAPLSTRLGCHEILLCDIGKYDRL